jgi:transcriptional regulator with XRE-family HTH domain
MGTNEDDGISDQADASLIDEASGRGRRSDAARHLADAACFDYGTPLDPLAIKRELKRLGYTQKELGAFIGIDRDAVNKSLNGVRKFTAIETDKVRQFFIGMANGEPPEDQPVRLHEVLDALARWGDWRRIRDTPGDVAALRERIADLEGEIAALRRELRALQGAK